MHTLRCSSVIPCYCKLIIVANVIITMQCQIQESNGAVTRNGVCPDTQNDVHSVSGYRDNCKTCIKYSRSLKSGNYEKGSGYTD